jgi:tetratricopeptide (TPR) repeat protein
MNVRQMLIRGGAVLCMPLAAGAQATGTAKWADSARREIDAANAQADLPQLTAAAAMLERALIATPSDHLLLYYRALALYRAAGVYTGQKRNEEARRALEEADHLLEDATSKNPSADALALRGAVIGQLIGVSGNPFAGMTQGPKASGLIDRAMELEPKNPRVWLIRGISAMFTPRMFGGGTDKAERDLRKAIELFPGDSPTPPNPSWGHAEAYVWLGQALQKEGRMSEARAAYDRALEIQPNYAWVQRVLIPSLHAKSE